MKRRTTRKTQVKRCEKDDSESEDEEESQSNTTENDQDESLVSSSESSNSDNDKNKLLIILLDGVNTENIARDEKKLKAFEAIKTNGCLCALREGPVFPSNPMPNWYSIATGRYPDKTRNHQRLHVRREESSHISKRLLKGGESRTQWWNGDAEPIWVTARKQKKRVSVSWWAGCDIIIKRSRPQFCDAYEDGMSSDPKYTETVTNKLTDIMDKFAKDELDLAMVVLRSDRTISASNRTRFEEDEEVTA